MQGIISTTSTSARLVNSTRKTSPGRLRDRDSRDVRAPRAAAAAHRTAAGLRRPPIAAAGEAGAKTPSAHSNAPFTCRRCLRRVASPADNHGAACSFHPALYSGGEAGKALGFVRASAEPGDQLMCKTGRQGLMRFWDCCGREDVGAEGCERGWHVSFDEAGDAARGWE